MLKIPFVYHCLDNVYTMSFSTVFTNKSQSENDISYENPHVMKIFSFCLGTWFMSVYGTNSFFLFGTKTAACAHVFRRKMFSVFRFCDPVVVKVNLKSSITLELLLTTR